MQKEIPAAGMQIEIPVAGMGIKMETADTVAQDKEEAAPVNAVHTGAGEANACFTYV